MKFNKNNELTLRNEGDFGFFNPFFNDFFGTPFKKELRELNKVMKTDIKEGENSYDMQVEMPGFDKKDVKMHFDDGYLTIEAEKNQSNDEKNQEGNFICRERSYGSCSRSFYVGDVEEKDIKAKLEDGVLVISVPKQAKKLDSKKYIEIE